MISVHSVKDVKEKLEVAFGKCFPGEPLPDFQPNDFVSCVHELGEWKSWSVMNIHGYVSWGGVMPAYRGNGQAHFESMLTGARQIGATDCSFVVRQANVAMQIIALKNEFRIWGITTGRDGKLEIIFRRKI